jgi:hypothetical protein
VPLKKHISDTLRVSPTAISGHTRHPRHHLRPYKG